jgi:hypothetical protein
MHAPLELLCMLRFGLRADLAEVATLLLLLF